MRLALVQSVALFACGDNIDGLSIDEYPAAYHEAYCEYVMGCGIANRSECDLPNVGVWTPDPLLVDAVRDGRIVWDPVAAHSCLAGWHDIGCDWTSESVRDYACAPIVRGTLVEGQTCSLDRECISNECFNEFCREACCAGVCVGTTAPTPGRVDEPCRTVDCAEGYCDGGVCRPFVDEGGSCETSTACTYGLGCKSQKCVRVPDRGESCTPFSSFEECRQRGDHCSTVTYRCEPLGHAGSTCFGDSDCDARYECIDQRCELAARELGEECREDRGFCATPGAICSTGITTRPACILPRAAGEPCAIYYECASNICDYESGTCQTLEGCL